MSRLTEAHKQQLKVRETQMELGTDNYVGQTPLSDDFEGKLEAAQQQLETLQAEQERVERQKIELADLNDRKEEFLQGQVEVSEKLSTSITAIERGLFEMRQEMEDLEQTKTSFSEHLEKVQGLDPGCWTSDNLKGELKRAISAIDLAEDEYDHAVEVMKQRESGVLSNPTRPAAIGGRGAGTSFPDQLKAGLAFNLPILILGTLALVVYFVK